MSVSGILLCLKDTKIMLAMAELGACYSHVETDRQFRVVEVVNVKMHALLCTSPVDREMGEEQSLLC